MRKLDAHSVALISLSICLLFGFAGPSIANDDFETLQQIASEALPNICSQRLSYPPVASAEITNRKQFNLRRGQGRFVDWRGPDGRRIKVSRISMPRGKLTFLDFYAIDQDTKPVFRGVINARCRVLGGRHIVYGMVGKKEQPLRVEMLDRQLERTGRSMPINPPVPPAQANACSTRIGILDNGVNYLQPDIARRLARMDDGGLIGKDVWENDNRPFDYGVPPGRPDPRISLFNPNRHGTMVASVFLDYAPKTACIVPVRYPPFDDNDSIDRAIRFFKQSGVKVVSLQSSRKKPWPAFRSQIQNHPDILFIMAAGNNRFDLNDTPMYPTNYDLPNVLVVGGTTGDDTLWRRSNYGQGIVDIAVLAEDVPVTLFIGQKRNLSGTSFAAPKVAGYAAKLIESNPNLSGAQLHDAIVSAAQSSKRSASGIPILTEETMLD